MRGSAARAPRLKGRQRTRAKACQRDRLFLVGRLLADATLSASKLAAYKGHSTLNYLTTRALPPDISFSTSFSVAIEVSPGVVIASAPWAAP